MKFFALSYQVINDYAARRHEFRDAHLAAAAASLERGEIILGGAYADPVDGALIIFRARDREVVEAFARADPYVANGLVTGWTVREWTVVVGQDRF